MKLKKIFFVSISICILVKITTAQVPVYVPTSGLVGYWLFSGNTNDVSGNGNNGVNNGGVLTTDRNGTANSAYYFSSSGCATRIDVQVNTTSIQTGLTISIWVSKTAEGCISPRILEFRAPNDGPGEAQWGWGSPNPLNTIGMGSNTSTGFNCSYGVPIVPNNSWTHLVYTNDGINGRFYQDGILKGSIASTGNPILSGNAAFGRMNHPANDAFNGKLDDIGIWNRALTQCEVQQLYSGMVITAPSITTTASSFSICSGQNSILTATGANTYTWLPGNQTTASINVNPTVNTTYTVIGSNSGCTTTKSITIIVNALPTLTTISSSSVTCIGNTNTLSVSGAQTYTWQPGNLSGASVTVSPTSNTTYTVTGAIANGCTNTAVKTITVNALPTLTATTGSSAICIGSSNTLSVSGAQTYTWQPGNLSGASVTVSPTANTTYTVTGTNTNGCKNTAIKTITVNALPTLTTSASSTAICLGNKNTLSVSGAQTYTWQPGNLSGASVTVSPTSNTTYTVTGTNTNGCKNTAIKTITVNSLPISSIALTGNDSICSGTSTTLLGSGGVSYSWSNGANTALNTINATGIFTLVVTDANGCNDTSQISITVAPPIQINYNVTSPLCFGQNGSITYTTSGGIAPLNTQWLGSINTTNLAAGTYSSVTTDALGCQLNSTVAVTQPSQLQINTSASNVLCNGGQSGNALAIVNGGVSPYTYLWSNGANTSSISTLSSGVYSVHVLDANNCSTNTVVTITEPTALSASVNVTAATCIGALDGIAQLNVNGGITPYIYAWSNGSTSAINNNLSAGNYSVIVSDANACTYTLSVIVNDGALPCFAVPGGFSPNGDGINDTWEISGIDKYPNAVVTILNRWGQEIFNVTNYTTPWNGSYKGSILPTADYYYIIKLDSNSKPLTGTVTIKR